jgi:hypothetical protein
MDSEDLYRLALMMFLFAICLLLRDIGYDLQKANKIACVQLDYMGADPATKVQRDPCN